MATQADTKADAAAEKAYAEAAGDVSAKTVADAVETDAPKPAPDTGKIAKAVEAQVKAKAAPKKQAATRKAATRKTAKKAVAKKAPAKVKPARKVAVKAKKAAVKTVSKTSTPKPTITDLKDKIMATAKTTDFTKTAKEAAANAQTRLKTVYEKSQAYAGDVTEFTKGNLEALAESRKILATGVRNMVRGEVEAAKGAFETATADVKAMVAVKSPTELFKLQGEIARRNFDAAVARVSKNAETSMKLANDAFAPISSRMSVAAEKFSKAA